MEKSVHTRDYGVFRKLLREVREQRGVTQVELAERLDETQSYVSKVERGERRLDVVQLRQFCNALGTPLLEFIRQLEERLAGRKR